MRETIPIKIPVYKPYLFGNEKQYVVDCLDSTWISSRGKYLSLFEESCEEFLGLPRGNGVTAVSNGTVALHLALHALGIGHGDEVIVPSFTYIASVNAIHYVGAKPVFVDSCDQTWNIDPNKIAEKITRKTKAVMAVHLYGNPCDLNALQKICKSKGLFLIEDSAEAFGSKFDGNYTGTFGDCATFSFFGNKTITTGEGGLVTAKDGNVLDRIKALKSQAISQEKEYWHNEVGFNYRMTNLCAAIGLAQLENITSILERKVFIAGKYKQELNGLPLKFPGEYSNSYNSYWMVSVLLKTKDNRDNLRKYLADKGIETRPFFYPVHYMPMYKESTSYPVAEKLSSTGINLPSYPGLTDEEICYICNIIREFFR